MAEGACQEEGETGKRGDQLHCTELPDTRAASDSKRGKHAAATGAPHTPAEAKIPKCGLHPCGVRLLRWSDSQRNRR
jgi:hypothetical protein